MKVLLDECIDWRLARDILGHEVKTARQMGWTAIKNGELLNLAAGRFDVFVTDRNLSLQQNLISRPIAVLVLQAKTNRLSDLRPLVPSLLAAVIAAQPGTRYDHRRRLIWRPLIAPPTTLQSATFFHSGSEI